MKNSKKKKENQRDEWRKDKKRKENADIETSDHAAIGKTADRRFPRICRIEKGEDGEYEDEDKSKAIVLNTKLTIISWVRLDIFVLRSEITVPFLLKMTFLRLFCFLFLPSAIYFYISIKITNNIKINNN